MQGEWELPESQLEARLRTWAIPVALGGSFLLVATGPGRFLVRVFLSMWVHEIGHATTAWLCGFPAFPGPWLTPMAQSRSPLFGLIVFLALGVGVALQLFCTLALSVSRAKQLVVFMGDGGCLVLGSLLMLTVYAPEDSSLKRGWLRWGFLAIGAAAFADAFTQWWASRTDFDRIPFGMNEGAGLSDPSVLSENFGWSTNQIVHRYVALGFACLTVVAIAYVRGLMRARSD
ncbi:MAG: hypothetical protein E6J58_10465 [Deltaproteobacteria bacterium]|nr:MAG: hypothetical protein E6J58_10465 [Deltaproteobacteria bacterium]